MTYEDRNALHRYMGPPEEHPCCDGRGWLVVAVDDADIPDTSEAYCACECGELRRQLEGDQED